MKSAVSTLDSIIGNANTLMITCHECDLNLVKDMRTQVFMYCALGNILHHNDYWLNENIRYFIQEKRCTQIMVVGHKACTILPSLLANPSPNTTLAALKADLETLQCEHHVDVLRRGIREQALVELNVISQSRLLMKTDFIREGIEAHTLSLSGHIIDDHSTQVKTVFHNGITFNDFISMN